MRIIVSGGHSFKLTDDLKNYALEKIVKFEKIVEEPAICEVIISDELGPKDGTDKSVHITLTLPGEKNPLHIEVTTSDFYGSIDLAEEKLEREIIKYKDKVKIGDRHNNSF